MVINNYKTTVLNNISIKILSKMRHEFLMREKIFYKQKY